MGATVAKQAVGWQRYEANQQRRGVDNGAGGSQEQKLQRLKIVRGTVLAEIFERVDNSGNCPASSPDCHPRIFPGRGCKANENGSFRKKNFFRVHLFRTVCYTVCNCTVCRSRGCMSFDC